MQKHLLSRSLITAVSNPQSSKKMSAISVLWTVLSVLFTGLWSIAVISPFWFENVPDPDPLSSDNSSFAAFGMLRFCSKKNIQSVFEMDEWHDFKNCAFYTSFQAIPSLFWKFGVIFYGVGLLTSICAVILAHISCCYKVICSKSVFGIAGGLQVASVICMIVSLVLFPFGFNSKFVSTYCGATGLFNPGSCHISWAYTVAIMNTGLFIFCPILAKHLFLVTPRSKATVV